MRSQQKTKQLNRIEAKNKQDFYDKIKSETSEEELQNVYRKNYQNIYYMYDLFKDKKSKVELENSLKEVDPSIKYSPQIQTMIMGISKIFLIQLFEEGVEVKGKMKNKSEIDDEVLEEAYRRIQSRNFSNDL